MNKKQLGFEKFEPRIALSANPTFGDAASRFGLIPRSDMSSSFVSVQSDNTTRTARDLGSLNGTRVFRNEYVGANDERDVYRFELARDGELNVQLDHLSSDADVYLLDAGRNTIASSRNAGARADSIRKDLSAGEYFLVVQNYSAFRGTNYWLSMKAELTPPAPVADSAGESIREALDIGSIRGSRSFNGNVGGADRADYIKFQLEEATRLRVSLSGLSQDVDIYLLSSSGRRLVSSDRSGASAESIDAWVAKGTYHLAIVPYESATSSYHLNLQANLSSDPTPEPEPEPERTPTPTPTPPAPTTPATPVPPQITTPTIPADPQAPEPPSGPLADVPYFGSSSRDWGLNSINAPEAWSAGYTGEGITVAVIDTGVQTSHVDLAHSIWVNPGEIAGDGIDNDRNGYVDDLNGWDFVSRDNSPQDGNGHGTHVAGIIAAARNGVGGTGVAYASSILPIRVLDNNGSGNTADVARGIRYAVDNGADVINLSLGGGNSQSVYSALQYAQQNDVLVVAASGNESSGTPGYPARHSATLSNVISVGSHASDNRRSSFSNLVGASQAVQIDSPGQSIYSTYIGGRYATLSGTSMAAPYTSAVAALTLAADPSLTSTEIRNALTRSVGAKGSGSDSLGRLNAATAIPLALGGSVQTNSIAAQTNSGSRSQLRVYATLAPIEGYVPLPSDDDSDEFAIQQSSQANTVDFENMIELVAPDVASAKTTTSVA